MKGQPRCTALKCAFEPGAGTVLIERRPALPVLGGHVYMRCGSYALRRGARWYCCGAFPFMFPLRAHCVSCGLVVPLGTQRESASHVSRRSLIGI